MLSRPGSSIIFKRLLMAALLAGVFFASAGLVTYLTVRGRTAEVPNLIGKYEEEAASLLDEAGLILRVKGRAHHDKWPLNTIYDQSPSPGTIVKTGQIVRVSLSLGTGSPAQTAQK